MKENLLYIAKLHSMSHSYSYFNNSEVLKVWKIETGGILSKFNIKIITCMLNWFWLNPPICVLS